MTNIQLQQLKELIKSIKSDPLEEESIVIATLIAYAQKHGIKSYIMKEVDPIKQFFTLPEKKHGSVMNHLHNFGFTTNIKNDVQ